MMYSPAFALAVTTMGLHIAACAETQATPEPQGFIIVSSLENAPCTVQLDISSLTDEDREIVFRRVGDQVEANVYRSDFPALSNVSLFRPEPCVQAEFEDSVEMFAREVLNIDSPNIERGSDDHIVYIENYENLDVTSQLAAVVDLGETGGHCHIRREYDPSYDYMMATLGAIHFVRASGFPVIDLKQSNNEIEYTFYVPCGDQVEQYIAYIESQHILSVRTLIE